MCYAGTFLDSEVDLFIQIMQAYLVLSMLEPLSQRGQTLVCMHCIGALDTYIQVNISCLKLPFLYVCLADYVH